VSIAVAIGMSVMACARGEERRDLRLGALGDNKEIALPGCSVPMAWCSARLAIYLRHDGPEHVLCFAPTRSARASASSCRRC
jgi:type IV secretion system protein VirD4